MGLYEFRALYSLASTDIITCLLCLDDIYYKHYKEELGIP